MRLVALAILFTVILVIWGVGRTPPGIVRHVINRMSAIGAFVLIGLGIVCFVLESSGYFLSIEGWVGLLLEWLIIFWLIYRRTKPPTVVNPHAQDLDETSESN